MTVITAGCLDNVLDSVLIVFRFMYGVSSKLSPHRRVSSLPDKESVGYVTAF